MMKKISLIISILLLLCACTSSKTIDKNDPKKVSNLEALFSGKKKSEVLFSLDELSKLDFEKLFDGEYISYKNIETFNFELNSNSYLLIDLINRDALYGKNYDVQIYPASLTKLITLDTILNNVDSLIETSSYTYEQYEELCDANASMAYLSPNKEYSIKDLLYALVLPSGADAAKALENYCVNNLGVDLVKLMNDNMNALKANNTNIINTTGLHDDNHYTSLQDLTLCIRDILKFEEGRNILSTFFYTLEDGNTVTSTLSSLAGIEQIEVHGGKTGFTYQAGQNIALYYTYQGYDYLLLTANAMADNYAGKSLHFDDVINIVYNMYND